MILLQFQDPGRSRSRDFSIPGLPRRSPNSDPNESLSAKCTWLRRPLVMMCLIAASFENFLTVLWLVKSELDNFIFCWAMASIGMNLFVGHVIQRLKNRTIVLVWLWLQGKKDSVRLNKSNLNSIIFRRANHVWHDNWYVSHSIRDLHGQKHHITFDLFAIRNFRIQSPTKLNSRDDVNDIKRPRKSTRHPPASAASKTSKLAA